jgi:hypothetical protein
MAARGGVRAAPRLDSPVVMLPDQPAGAPPSVTERSSSLSGPASRAFRHARTCRAATRRFGKSNSTRSMRRSASASSSRPRCVPRSATPSASRSLRRHTRRSGTGEDVLVLAGIDLPRKSARTSGVRSSSSVDDGSTPYLMCWRSRTSGSPGRRCAVALELGEHLVGA